MQVVMASIVLYPGRSSGARATYSASSYEKALPLTPRGGGEPERDKAGAGHWSSCVRSFRELVHLILSIICMGPLTSRTVEDRTVCEIGDRLVRSVQHENIPSPEGSLDSSKRRAIRRLVNCK